MLLPVFPMDESSGLDWLGARGGGLQRDKRDGNETEEAERTRISERRITNSDESNL